ncbi:MAG TPA: histidinol-phosphate transaminase [Alphaproteobacteria bacterium]|nr:histidinol-phosphate transaminase [Alphaproteobacteria bacterium]
MFLSNPALASHDAYVPGLSKEYVSQAYGIPVEDIAKLGSAENPLGPSPKAAKAVQAAMSRLEVYPEWTARALREKVAVKYGVSPDQVVCGAGETEIISWIIRVFAAPGDKVLMFAPAFPIYHMTAENEGRVPVFVSMGEELDFKMDAYLAAITDDVRIAFLTNPHSPTARLMPEEQIRRVCERAKGQLVVLDEAYIHFTQTAGGFRLLKDYPNLIVLRTFSKAFGLAGLRVGFGIASPEIIRPLLNIKPTWNMGQLQVTGAVAALDDDEHVNKTVSTIVEMRAYVIEKLRKLNRFRVIGEPRSNFFLLRIEDDSLDSTKTFNELLKRGVIVKDGSVSFVGLGKRHLRIDVSLKKHMDRLIWALSEIGS